MFRGNSCHPISPSERGDGEVDDDEVFIDNNDQILKIIQKIPVDMKEDLSFLSHESHLEYVNMVCSNSNSQI